jgi:hypothetical protein
MIPIDGQSKLLSIRQVIRMAIGGRVFFSKRMAPPMTICNSRIFSDNDFVFSTDLELRKYSEVLTNIAEGFGVTITVRREVGDKPVWSSETPTLWLGYNPHTEKYDQPTIDEVYPWFVKRARETQRQWCIDHGLTRRNFKEWCNDFWYWRIKCRWWAIKSKFEKSKE